MSWHKALTAAKNNAMQLGQQLLVAICFFALLAAASGLSNLLETVAQSSAIYLPAGVKLAFVLILPTRFWPLLWLTSRLYAAYQGTFYTGVWHFELFHAFWLELFFYALVFCFKQSRWPPNISSTQNVISLLLLALLASAFKWFLFASAFEFTTGLDTKQLLQYQLNMTLGDLTGALLVTPIAIAAAHYVNHTAKKATPSNYTLLCTLVLFATAATFCYLLRPDIYPFLRLSALLPVIWLAYLFGVRGAVAGGLVANSLIVAEAAVTQTAENTYISQLFIIANATTSLILGAATEELRKKNRALRQSNLELQALLHKNQNLAAKMVNIQEHERKHLSQELHDELGQNLTALKTELAVLASISTEQVKSTVNALKSNADSMYESVYDLMHYLRPRELDELGLEKALSQGQFAATLNKAGITYHCQLAINATLSESHQIALYRICQEALTNCIKHSNATLLTLTLATKHNEITLKIIDNGNAAATSSQSGKYGLSFIEERVTALGGHCSFENNDGFSVAVWLPL